MSLVMPGLMLAYAQQHQLTQEEFDAMLNATMSIAKSKQKMLEFVMLGLGERIIIDTGASYLANIPEASGLYQDLKYLSFKINMDNGGDTSKDIHFLLLEHEFKDFADLKYLHAIYSYEGVRLLGQPPDVLLEFANYTNLGEATHNDIIDVLGSYYNVSIESNDSTEEDS